MHLMKWFRKNKSKIMVVVIFIAILGFIGGSYIQSLARRNTGTHRVIAHFLDDKEITNYDLAMAQQELETLRMLQADNLLKRISTGITGVPDFRAFLLSELLFSDQRLSTGLLYGIKQLVRTNNYRITDRQLNDIYRRPERSNVLWLLLKKEAQLSEIRVPNDDARRALTAVFQGQGYTHAIRAIINRLGVSEEKVLETFGKLLAVFEYSKAICSGENATIRQIMNAVSHDEETIDVEFVQFDASAFSDRAVSPTDEQIQTQFDKYKNYFAGDLGKENPYGFGYKLNERAGLEYIIVKLDDVASTVTSPTEEEKEQYYQIHREEYTTQETTDANDPNSTPLERNMRYWEAANIIEHDIIQKRINSKTEKILQKARELVEEGLVGREPAGLSSEELGKLSGDYEEAAEKLSDIYKIKVYSGKTGLLDVTDIQLDGYLGMLYLTSPNYNPASLMQLVFAIDELGTSKLGVFDVPKPKMYENIGPLKQIVSIDETSGKIMAMVRVCQAQKAAMPGLDSTYRTQSVVLDEQQPSQEETTYSVKQEVVNDLKKLTAMKTAKANAEQFAELLKKDSWETALEQINKLYGKADLAEAFALGTQNNLRRSSQGKIETLKAQNQGNPLSRFAVTQSRKETAIVNDFYSLLGESDEKLENVPLVMESASNMSYYVIKNLSVRRIDTQQYNQLKTIYAYAEDTIQSQSLAVIHYNPQNILKRLNFRIVKQEPETEEEPETEGA